MKTNRSIFVFLASWSAVLGWFALLWYLSSLPGSKMPQLNFPHADKVVHFSYFFIGGILLWLALKATLPFRFWRLVLIVVCVMAGIGLLDEKRQLRTPQRTGGDWGDWLADCSGGAVGAILIGWIYVRRRKPAATDSLALPGNSQA